ncbi:MAG: hypothetical protein B6I32_05775, partial [Desulfobacterium sp. 4572_20]
FENNNYEPCKFLTSISIDSFPKASRELNDRFKRPPVQCHQPVKTCKQCIESLYPIIPQKLDAKGLFVSEFLTSLRNKKGKLQGYICNGDNTICTKVLRFPSWEKSCLLWIAGESLFQADKIWWGKFGIDILKEGGLNAPVEKDTTVVIGPISFFYDKSPDLVYAFFIDPKSPPDIAQHLLGLTYAMKEARKAWLFDWVGRLADTIMKMEDPNDFEFLGKYGHLENRYNDYKKEFLKSLDRAKKLLRVTYAREALEWMARVLAFFEASPEDALRDQSISTFLDYNTDDSIEISQALRKIDTEQGRITIWQPFLSKNDPQGDNFQRSRARLLFIREFLEQSADTINSALDVKGVVKIKGSKAAKLMADLVRHVRLNPLTGKILLLGAPGGGKGLTANRYHELAIEEIKKNEPLLKKTIEEIWKRLVNILMLPKAREVMDDEDNSIESGKRLLNFVKAQLQGTKWWYWNIPGDTDKNGDSLWPCRDKASCAKISIINNACKVDEICKKCPLKPYFNELVQKKLPNIASNPTTEPSVQFMLHYLARLLYAAYGIENESGPKPKENFVHILCGVLAEQGPEFISSMRRLFGTAENVGVPLPGLFQTASYMGGTVFLDEIADAPVKIQDNLLGPLEEKKVSRLGWESIKEDVGNIRIVAATHKDIRARVKLYTDTADSPMPQGFRSDLLSRLIIFPPVYPSSVTEYFLYENEEERKVNQMDFISIMLEILGLKEKDVGVKYPDDDRRRRFLKDLYNTVDDYIEKTIRMMDFPEPKLRGVKKNLVDNITTRLFVGILEEVALAEKRAEHFEPSQAFLNARLSDILVTNLPKLLNYIVNPEV